MNNQSAQKGFVFSLEATIAILVFSLLLITINFPVEHSLKELVVVQQANDLLKVWSVHYPNNSEINFDTNSIFGDNASVFVDSQKVIWKECPGEAISSSAIILDDFLFERHFQIIICLE